MSLTRVGQPCGWRLILQTGDSIHKDDGVDGVMVWMEGGGVDTMGRQGGSAEEDDRGRVMLQWGNGGVRAGT